MVESPLWETANWYTTEEVGEEGIYGHENNHVISNNYRSYLKFMILKSTLSILICSSWHMGQAGEMHVPFQTGELRFWVFA